MFTLGILAVLQACFIPGFIIHRFVRPQASIFELLPLSFALSLVVNCLVVMVLVLLGIYTRSVVLSLIAVELLVGGVVLWRMRGEQSPINVQLTSPLRTLKDWRNTWPRVLSHLTIAATILFNVQMLGEAFTFWDPIVSYNRWALSWFQGELPAGTWFYPQLLPVIWSLVYKVMGTSDLHFIAKIVSFLFYPLSMFLFMDLWKKTGNTRFILAMPIWFLVAPFVLRSSIWGGYTDMPVAFMGLCAMYCYWCFEAEQKINHKTWFLFGMVCVAGAAEMKQAGLFLALLLPMVYYYRTRDDEQAYGISAKFWLFAAAIFCVTFVAWYVLTWYRVTFTGVNSGLGYVLEDIHEGRSYVERLIRAWELWKIPFILAFLSLPAIRYKHLAFPAVFGIGLVVAWGALLSYDPRNCILAIPLLAPCVAQTLLDISGWAKLPFHSYIKSDDLSTRFRCPRKGIIIAFALVVAGGTISISDQDIVQHQFDAQMRIYREDVNQLVKAAMDQHGPGTLLTTIEHLQFLPSPYGDNVVFYGAAGWGKEAMPLQNILKKKRPKYILVPSKATPAVHSIISDFKATHKITLLSETGPSRLWTIVNQMTGLKMSGARISNAFKLYGFNSEIQN